MKSVDSPWASAFPISQERQTLYFNSAGEGPYCEAASAALNQYLDEKKQPHHRPAASVFGTTQQIRSLAGQLFHADPDGFAFIHSTSEGMNILAQGYAWQPGDRVLLFEGEFPACVYPFLNLRHRGVHIDFCPCPDGIPDMAALEKLLVSKPRMLVCSWVQFSNGYTHDLALLRQLTEQHNCLLVLDITQGAGLIPLDLTTLGVDACVLSGHKTLCAPTGSGLLYLAPAMAPRFEVTFPGWLTQVQDSDFTSLTRYPALTTLNARRFETGSDAQLLQRWLLAMLQWFQAQGTERLHEHVRGLVEQLATGIDQRSLRLAGPAERRSVMCAFRCDDPTATKALFQQLAAAEVIASLREGWIRLSLHAYNSAWQVDTFLHRLDLILEKR